MMIEFLSGQFSAKAVKIFFALPNNFVPLWLSLSALLAETPEPDQNNISTKTFLVSKESKRLFDLCCFSEGQVLFHLNHELWRFFLLTSKFLSKPKQFVLSVIIITLVLLAKMLEHGSLATKIPTSPPLQKGGKVGPCSALLSSKKQNGLTKLCMILSSDSYSQWAYTSALNTNGLT